MKLPKQTILHRDGPVELVLHEDDGRSTYIWRRRDVEHGNLGFTMKLFNSLDELMAHAGVNRLNKVKDDQRV